MVTGEQYRRGNIKGLGTDPDAMPLWFTKQCPEVCSTNSYGRSQSILRWCSILTVTAGLLPFTSSRLTLQLHILIIFFLTLVRYAFGSQCPFPVSSVLQFVWMCVCVWMCFIHACYSHKIGNIALYNIFFTNMFLKPYHRPGILQLLLPFTGQNNYLIKPNITGIKQWFIWCSERQFIDSLK